MANPAVTYTFSNGTAADASQVNTNFTDIINSLTDATKSLSIDALTAAGAATFNGAVTLGNASGDDLTISASLSSDLVIKTDSTYDIGTSSVKLQNVYSDSINFGNQDLNYYEEGTHATTFTSGGNTSGSFNIRYVRVGKMVTLMFPQILFTLPGGNIINSDTDLATTLRPTDEAIGSIRVTDNGTVQASAGMMIINSSGNISMAEDWESSGVFAAGSGGIVTGGCITYHID